MIVDFGQVFIHKFPKFFSQTDCQNIHTPFYVRPSSVHHNSLGMALRKHNESVCPYLDQISSSNSFF